MDTMQAFMMGRANRGNELMIFDWAKAAHLIKENPNTEICAGLQGDWGYPRNIIWTEGHIVRRYVYLASTWATPEIEICGVRQDCYVMEHDRPDWDAHTFYPSEALEILGLSKGDVPDEGDD
jgi:hypothetical protein